MRGHGGENARLREPVDVAPFLAWCDRRLEHVTLSELMGEVGWPDETGQRRLNRWRVESRTGQAERADIEDALDRAGVGWWEVYDGNEGDDGQRWCGWCAERVAHVDGRCAWCETETLPEQPRPPARRRGVRCKISDADLLKLHRVHVEKGASINELARRVYRRVGYRTQDAAQRSISDAWRRLGLKARDRIEQTVLSSRKHGMAPKHGPRPGYGTYKRRLHREDQPVCEGVKRQAPRAGSPCTRPAMFGSRYCYSHDPRRELERQAATARMRRRQPAKTMLPAVPFVAWMRALRAEHGTWGAVADVLGVNVSAVHRYGQGRGSNRERLAEVGLDTVRRYAERAGTTVEAIYGEPASDALERAA